MKYLRFSFTLNKRKKKSNRSTFFLFLFTIYYSRMPCEWTQGEKIKICWKKHQKKQLIDRIYLLCNIYTEKVNAYVYHMNKSIRLIYVSTGILLCLPYMYEYMFVQFNWKKEKKCDWIIFDLDWSAIYSQPSNNTRYIHLSRLIYMYLYDEQEKWPSWYRYLKQENERQPWNLFQWHFISTTNQPH
jgi:hypothetical protein